MIAISVHTARTCLETARPITTHLGIELSCCSKVSSQGPTLESGAAVGRPCPGQGCMRVLTRLHSPAVESCAWSAQEFYVGVQKTIVPSLVSRTVAKQLEGFWAVFGSVGCGGRESYGCFTWISHPKALLDWAASFPFITACSCAPSS